MLRYILGKISFINVNIIQIKLPDKEVIAVVQSPLPKL